MYVQRAVDFDSINYLPGFPSLSIYDCDPFSWNGATGGCATAPVAVGRELNSISDATSMALATLQASNKLPVRLGKAGDRHRRIGMGKAGDRHRRTGMAGCGCGGSCGGCGDNHGLAGLGIAMTDVVTWLETNWMALLIGGGVVWFLKRR